MPRERLTQPGPCAKEVRKEAFSLHGGLAILGDIVNQFEQQSDLDLNDLMRVQVVNALIRQCITHLTKED